MIPGLDVSNSRRTCPSVCLSVCLPTLAGRSGPEVWRLSAELGRRSSQSWAGQASAEGLHQLHGSVVLEGRRRQGHVVTAARRNGAGRGGSATQPPACTLPSPPPPPHSAPPRVPANHTAQTCLRGCRHPSVQGPQLPERLCLLPQQSRPRSHDPPAARKTLVTMACPGFFHQPGGLKAWPPCSPTMGTQGSLATKLLLRTQRERGRGVQGDDPQRRPAPGMGHP